MTFVIKCLILVSAYGIFRIVSEIINNKKCPSDQELRDVALGLVKKNTSKADRIIMHLGGCEKCRAKVKNIGAE